VKNKLSDLNNHLFEQIERLNDDELTGDDLRQEVHRAQAMCSVAGQVIANGRLVLAAVKAADENPGVGKVRLFLE
jgi:hypothetical protein